MKDVQAIAHQAYGDGARSAHPTIVSRFYITTPIYYINAQPHLGHAYTRMVADAIARAHRLMGEDVFFLTGTDEHGQKVERAAQKAALPITAFADRVAQSFRDILPALNVSNDDFIRTTEPRHHRASQALWRRVQRSRIHLQGQVRRAGTARSTKSSCRRRSWSTDTVRSAASVVERIAEESYFFKLSAFQQPLLEHYRKHPEFVSPAIRRNEMVSFLENGLEDLSISRTSFKWGIPVPDDPAHVMYVWFDALTNYMTAVGWGSDDPKTRRGSPNSGRWTCISSARKSFASTPSTGRRFSWPRICRCRGGS